MLEFIATHWSIGIWGILLSSGYGMVKAFRAAMNPVHTVTSVAQGLAQDISEGAVAGAEGIDNKDNPIEQVDKVTSGIMQSLIMSQLRKPYVWVMLTLFLSIIWTVIAGLYNIIH